MAEQRIGALIRATTIAVFIVLPGHAAGDDTELYVGLAAELDRVNPNVLFVIDTSGSMGSAVEQTTPYDPAARYVPGPDGECADDDVVYFNDDGPPDCERASRRFATEKLVCRHARENLYGESGAAITGFYSDQFAAWQTHSNPSRERWTDSGFHRSNREFVECEDDAGDHGRTAGSAAWPRNGRTGPWISSAPGNAIWNDWDEATVYSAHYLRWYHFHRGVGASTRLDVVKAVTRDIVDSVSGINVGLMRFDRTTQTSNSTFRENGSTELAADSQGGYVVYPVRDVDAPGVREEFTAAVNALTDGGYTPLSETLFEAMQYYRGQAVTFGIGDNGAWSHADSRSADRYVSPITHACGRNYIVFLSDGIANTDNAADDAINARLRETSLADRACENGDHWGGYAVDNCLDELAGYLFHTDSATESLGNDLPDTQNIVTYTVGFNIEEGEELLREAARRSESAYYFAASAQDLASVFTRIIEGILRVNATFTSPAVSINAFNRLAHREEMYFTVFRPDDRPHWDGNVKQFRLREVLDASGNPVDADGDGESDFALVDANGNPAIDPQTGFFRDSARSGWTPDDFAPDGDTVRDGGMASRLFTYDDADDAHQSDSRQDFVFTLTGAPGDPGGNLNPDLSHPDNRLHEVNARTADNPAGKLTKAHLGVPGHDDDAFINLVRWARGVDVNDDNENGRTDDGRPVLGASLHTKPYLLTYAIDEETRRQDDYLFVFTNDGYVHMAATDDGLPASDNTSRLEAWTFMPPDKLTQIKTLYDDEEVANISYGLDGGVDAWFNDANADGALLTDDGTVADGEHAYLYFGQRRGGENYYALDVSRPGAPRFLWSATGDDSRPATTYLDGLGQTWSRPRHTRIYDTVGDSLFVRDVVIFGGGYDTGQDDAGERTADNAGNAVFLLDARTGDLIWWASDGPGAAGNLPDLQLTDMRYSIPADIRVIDVNGDGVMDRFYTADMGGQVWRFDIINEGNAPLSERIFGGRIADLQIESAGSSETAANNRRFYYPPDIALIEPDAGPRFHSVAIGSGYRAHPNDDSIEDRIYLLKDYAVKGPPRDEDGEIVYRTRHEGDLLDVTDRIDLGDLTDAEKQRLSTGWMIRLETPGEKVLSNPVTANNRIMLTTYVPADDSIDSRQNVCAPSQGAGRIYALDASDGAPVANLDGLGDPDGGRGAFTLKDRFKSLKAAGIPPDVVIVYTDPSKSSPIPTAGPELVPELKLDNAPRRTYWYQEGVH